MTWDVGVRLHFGRILMLLTVNVMRRVPWPDMRIRFRVSDGYLMSLLALPLALLLTAVVMFVSTFARSFKEAQGYIGMLILLPMLPGVAVAADGSLLVTDDGARVIWRVSYIGPRGAGL